VLSRLKEKMSLESKLANLSLGDESSVVEAIKAEGVDKSGYAANVAAICGAIEGKDAEKAIAALATVKAVAEGAVEAEAFNGLCLSSCKFYVSVPPNRVDSCIS
jgi:hypothetical protein